MRGRIGGMRHPYDLGGTLFVAALVAALWLNALKTGRIEGTSFVYRATRDDNPGTYWTYMSMIGAVDLYAWCMFFWYLAGK
jgi:hypothetical protein